ncbi:MAG: RCC1 domain-containing protein [Rhodoluna sp.]
MKLGKLKIFAALVAVLCSQHVSPQSSVRAEVLQVTSPISVGANSTCAIRSIDNLYCVGSNSFGQLGNGSNISTTDPQRVVGINNVASVSVGDTSTCAVTKAGALYCWGDNSSGQLGIGTTESKNSATLVSSISNVSRVSVGSNFACALDNAGLLFCWGANDQGQLANDSKTGTLIPVRITAAPAGLLGLAVNGKRVCVLATEVSCWGAFASFVFPSELREWVPVKVAGSAGATSVHLGKDFGCLNFGNSVSCWGANDHGQLGNGTKVQSSSLVKVDAISNAVQLALGDHFGCTTDTMKETYCWGQNGFGQLGVSAGPDQVTRIPTGAESSAYIAAGGSTLCSLELTGAVHCQGDSNSGQTGFLQVSSTPLVNSSETLIAKVSAGADTTCALSTAGSLNCWGALSPVMPESTSFVDVSVGNNSACAVTTVKKVLCWGSNGSGQLGDDSIRTSLVMTQAANATAEFTKVAVGYRHACAVTVDGLIYCWGDNSHLQLGSSGSGSKVPKVVPGIASARTLALGDYHSCIQQGSGTVTCWGDNSKKQINTSATKFLPPTDLLVREPVSSFGLGSYNTCMLYTSKTLQCFGDNSKKQAPGSVVGSFQTLSVGSTTVCATNLDSKVMCFGSADSGKLGSITVNTSTPTLISATLASSVSVGDGHACLISTLGSMACWGLNDSGQLASSFGFPSAFATPLVSIMGPLAVGETLTAQVSSSETSTTFTYLWKRSTKIDSGFATLSSQTSPTISLSSSDLGRYFTVEIRQSKWGVASISYVSKPVGAIGAAVRLLLTPTPTVSGTNKVGRVLRVLPGRWDSGVQLKYQWFRGKTIIKGATAITYRLAKLDLGKQISVSVTASKVGVPKVVKKSAKSSKIVG